MKTLFLWSTLGLVFSIQPIMADQESFQKTVQEYRHANQSISSLLTSQKNLLPHYSTEVKETKLYDKTDDENDALGEAGKSSVEANTTMQDLKDNISNRPKINLNLDDPDFQKSELIQENADKILDQGMETSTCKLSLTNQKCIESVRALHRVCVTTPNITIQKTTTNHASDFSGTINATSMTSGTFTVLFDGVITQFSVTLKSPNVWLCHRHYQGFVNGYFLSEVSVNCGHWLGDLHFENTNLSIPVQQNTPIAFHFNGYSQGSWSWANYSVTIRITDTNKTAHITWQEGCQYV